MVAAARCEPVARTTRRVNPIDRKALVVNIQLNTMNTNTQRTMANTDFVLVLALIIGWLWKRLKNDGGTLVRLVPTTTLLHPREPDEVYAAVYYTHYNSR